MAENIESPDDTPEVEAHGSVLDLQGLGKDMDKVEGNCLSVLSVVESGGGGGKG
ncbi:hypothetical protein ACWDG1_44450 [Streptomyces sp. NPDC001177]